MAVNCGVSFGLCRTRVTRVDSNGNVIAGHNAYVTDAALSISVTPNIETGTAISVRNGCGCKISSFKFPDTFNWFEFAFVDTTLEPVLEAFMLGAETIVDGSDVVGLAYPSSLACDEDEPAVALRVLDQAHRGIGPGRDPPVGPLRLPHVHLAAGGQHLRGGCRPAHPQRLLPHQRQLGRRSLRRRPAGRTGHLRRRLVEDGR